MPNNRICKSIRIENIKPGMITGKDVLNDKGQLILRKGMELTESLINQLKRLGIAGVPIELEEEVVDLGPEAAEEEMRRVEALLERKFRLASSDNRVMMGFKEVLKEYWRERSSRGSAGH